jgi:hypothetical protein
MSNVKRAILPTQDIVNSVHELMVERDLGEVSFDALMSIVVDAASVIEINNFYEPYDTVSNALSGLDLEYDEVTISAIRISEVDGLDTDICNLAQKLAKRFSRTGINNMGGEHLPLVELTNITSRGDLIVDITAIEED